MTTPNASVSDDKQTPQVADATQGDTKGVAKTTPNQSSGDGEAKLAELQSQYEKVLSDLGKYQTDINQLKSASQKREYELGEELKQSKAELERYREQMLTLMDDETRSEYENATRAAQFRELQDNAQQAQIALQREQALNNAFSTFLSRGVPVETLLAARDGGVESMATAAWDWLQEQATNKSTSTSEPPQKSEPEPPPEAPDVVTDTTESPFEGQNWDELVKNKFGGDEDAAFTAIEQGSLPPDVHPDYRRHKKSLTE